MTQMPAGGGDAKTLCQASAGGIGDLVGALGRIRKARHRIGIIGKHCQVVDHLLLMNVAHHAGLVNRIAAQRQMTATAGKQGRQSKRGGDDDGLPEHNSTHFIRWSR